MAPAMATPKAARSQPFTGAIVRRAWTRDAGHAFHTWTLSIHGGTDRCAVHTLNAHLADAAAPDQPETIGPV
jgi:hypothetical protein